MNDEVGPDLLSAWQDTTLATELAARLARAALEVADQADRGADEAEAVATLAEHAAQSADEVAATARAAAERARDRAGKLRAGSTADAHAALGSARLAEDGARERWTEHQESTGAA